MSDNQLQTNDIREIRLSELDVELDDELRADGSGFDQPFTDTTDDIAASAGATDSARSADDLDTTTRRAPTGRVSGQPGTGAGRTRNDETGHDSRTASVIISAALVLASIMGIALWLYYPREGDGATDNAALSYVRPAGAVATGEPEAGVAGTTGPAGATSAAGTDAATTTAGTTTAATTGPATAPNPSAATAGSTPAPSAITEPEIVIVYGSKPPAPTAGPRAAGTATEAPAAGPSTAPRVISLSDGGTTRTTAGAVDGTSTNDARVAGPETAAAAPAATTRSAEPATPPAAATASRTTSTQGVATVSRAAAVTPAPNPVAPVRATQSPMTEYWIQAISSPSRDRVDQVRVFFAEQGLGGRITTVNVDATNYYRFRIGPYQMRSEADKFLEWIRALDGYAGSYISEEYPVRPASN